MTFGTFLRLFEVDGSSMRIDAERSGSIDAAVSNYLDTGRDSLLHLMTLSGESFVVRASRITSWWVSTPEGRETSLRHDKEERDEEQASRILVGLPYKDPEL